MSGDMDTVDSSETFVTVYQTTWHYIPWYCFLNVHDCDMHRFWYRPALAAQSVNNFIGVENEYVCLTNLFHPKIYLLLF
jgi:hypothetical protein